MAGCGAPSLTVPLPPMMVGTEGPEGVGSGLTSPLWHMGPDTGGRGGHMGLEVDPASLLHPTDAKEKYKKTPQIQKITMLTDRSRGWRGCKGMVGVWDQQWSGGTVGGWVATLHPYPPPPPSFMGKGGEAGRQGGWTWRRRRVQGNGSGPKVGSGEWVWSLTKGSSKSSVHGRE